MLDMHERMKFLEKELDKAVEVIGKMYCMLYINNLDHDNEFEFDVNQAKLWISYYEKLRKELL